MRLVIIAVAIMATMFSCKSSDERFLPEVIGNPYEVVLVADTQGKNSAAADTLKAILSQDVEMINQLEPLYDIVTTTPKNFKNIMQKHRNVLFVDVNEKYDSSRVAVERDVYSDGQIILRAEGKTQEELATYLAKNQESLITLLDITEQKRMVAKIAKRNVAAINDTIANMFDIKMLVPSGYKIRNQIGDNFLWVSYEAPGTSQGFFIYTYPYDSTAVMTQKSMIDMRDQFAAMIPGPSNGSYMTTSDVCRPALRKVVINGREWVEQRGFWKVKNDFMGGPFISFTALDKKNSRVVVIDEYLYSPKNDKPMRNLLRQLENVAYTTSF